MYAFVILCFVLCTTDHVHAYIDPGTGSVLFSIILSITGVIFFAIASWWEKIKLWIFKDRKDNTRKPIVIYTESKRYYHVFNDVIDELEKRAVNATVYVSDEDDPFLSKQYQYINVENIGKGAAAFAKLAFISADVCLMTTPGLDVYQLKRSKNVKHYSHIFHCLTDGLCYRLFGIDYFDSILLNCEQSIPYIRELEKQRNLPAKELPIVGSTCMDSMVANLPASEKPSKTTILVAPSWGQYAILANYGDELLKQLSQCDYNIIIRPHPQSVISEQNVIEKLQTKFANCSNITWDFSRDNLQSMMKADILISDFSRITYEFMFLFNKPCIYSLDAFSQDIYDASDIDEAPYSIQILKNLGVELNLDNLQNLRDLIQHTIHHHNLSASTLADIKNEYWRHQGQSAQLVVDFLLKKQAEVSSC